MKMISDVSEITLYSPLNNHIFVPHFLSNIKGTLSAKGIPLG